MMNIYVHATTYTCDMQKSMKQVRSSQQHGGLKRTSSPEPVGVLGHPALMEAKVEWTCSEISGVHTATHDV